MIGRLDPYPKNKEAPQLGGWGAWLDLSGLLSSPCRLARKGALGIPLSKALLKRPDL